MPDPFLGGAFVIQHYHLADWINQGFFGIAAIAGVIFSAGLPMWVLVRAFFRYAEANRSTGILDIIRQVKQAWKGEQQ